MPCPCPVKPSCLPHDLTGGHQAKRAVRLHRDKKLVTVAEVQPLADHSRKEDAPPVSNLDARRLRVDLGNGVPQIHWDPVLAE